MRGLYPIIDIDTLNATSADPLEVAALVLEVHPPLLQLRAKHAPARQLLAMLRALRPLCDVAGTQLFANDRPDLAILGGCDGVHVGQQDPSPSEVRRLAPSLRVGVSTHSLAELDGALADRPDYVAFGPVHATVSKAAPDPEVGTAGLQQASIRARAAAVPLVAIGGITLGRATSVARFAELGAAISALLAGGTGSRDIVEQARRLHLALGGR
jgi:thiamine-phosphate pyrophosphorylase